jgi:NitT/TauT family transport system permease protein
MAAGTDALPLADDGVEEPELVEDAAAYREGGGRVRHMLGIVVPPLIVAGIAIGVWYFATYVALDAQRRFLLPPPHAVIQGSFIEADSRHEILIASYETAKVAVVGLAIASFLGIGTAVAMAQARWVERSFFPWAVVLQTVPILAIVPLIGFWWGFDFRSRVLVCVLISLFPMITNTLFGLRSVPAGLHDVFSLRRASRWTRLRKLEFPAALPAIFVGLQISAGLSVIGAIVGDFFFRQGDPGIGRLIDNYRAALASEQLFGAIIASSLLGILAFTLVGLVADQVIGRWHETGKRRQ